MNLIKIGKFNEHLKEKNETFIFRLYSFQKVIVVVYFELKYLQESRKLKFT
jgi:hypothetical protein